MYKKLFLIGSILLLALTVFHPQRHAKYYTFIPKLDTLTELVVNVKDGHSNLKLCDYKEILSNSKEIALNEIYQSHNFHTPRLG